MKEAQPPARRYSLLYVDDDKQNLFLFSTLLNQDFQVFTTDNGREALALLRKQSIQVIFADQRMPEMNGIQLLEAVSRDFPDIIRVLVTGYADIDVVIDAINRGSVYRYISKPWDNDELLATIKNAVELYELKQKNLALIASLNSRNELLQRKVQELKFLNELSIELNELDGFDAIVSRFAARLEGELNAESSVFQPGQADPSAATTSVPVEPEGKAVAPCGGLVPTGAGHKRSACSLPLAFQDVTFGRLILYFSPGTRFDRSETDFARAAANVASSILYSRHMQQDRLAKEKFFILGRTASMIVHDIKGPLTTMLGFVHLLRGEVGNAEREKYAGLVLDEINRLLEMVEELLFFSKGKVHLKLALIDVEGLLRECLGLFSVSFEKEKIVVSLQVDRECSLYGDYRKLKKALLNILFNARENLKNSRNPRQIAISARLAGGSVEIRMGNSGPPVPADITSKIFDPFFSHGKEDGTGLGLTICRNIIEEHQGTISLGRETQETEFLIRLPQMPGAAQEA